MNQKVSAAIGVVGGPIDIGAGFAYLQQSSPMQPTMGPGPTPWIGYFLLVLGVIVLLSGLYLLGARMLKSRAPMGLLMILYGLMMLALGFGMVGQIFSMVQGSVFSGTVMVIVGVAMLYSGYGMARM